MKAKAIMMARVNPLDLSTLNVLCCQYGLLLVDDNCDPLGCSYSMPRELVESLGSTENSL